MRARLALTLQAALMVLAISSLPDSASAQRPKDPLKKTCGCFCMAGSSPQIANYTLSIFSCFGLNGRTCNVEDPETHQILTGKLEFCDEGARSTVPVYQPPVGPGRPPVYTPPPYAPPIAEPPRRR